jgi:hypothetical protein
MLIAVIACILGIVAESYYWPIDRSVDRARLDDAATSAAQASVLVGLVLSHPVVRWLVAFAVGATIVLVAIEAAGGREWLRSIVGSGSLSLDALDAVVGATIALVMAALAVAARAIASKS